MQTTYMHSFITQYGISDALLHREVCSTVDNRNPQTGAHFTSPVCSALVTHSPAHQIQAAGTRLSLSTPTSSCTPITDLIIPYSPVRSRCHELSLPLNRVCAGQSSDSERARDQWQWAAVTPQVNLSFSFVSCISKHLIEYIAIESS